MVHTNGQKYLNQYRKLTCYTLIRYLFLCCFFVGSASAMTLADLQTQFNQHEINRAEFQQERHIKGLNNLLVSTGNLIISKKYGLWWHQKQPFDLVLRLNETQMIQTMQGQSPEIMTSKSHPQVFQLSYLLTALFRGDINVLKENFALDFKVFSMDKSKKSNKSNGLSKGWSLVLIPKTAPLNQIFKQIELVGSNVLDSITMSDLQGDLTIISLFNQSNSETLRQNEHLYFLP